MRTTASSTPTIAECSFFSVVFLQRGRSGGSHPTDPASTGIPWCLTNLCRASGVLAGQDAAAPTSRLRPAAPGELGCADAAAPWLPGDGRPSSVGGCHLAGLVGVRTTPNLRTEVRRWQKRPVDTGVTLLLVPSDVVWLSGRVMSQALIAVPVPGAADGVSSGETTDAVEDPRVDRGAERAFRRVSRRHHQAVP
jgi:hypothetical protein